MTKRVLQFLTLFFTIFSTVNAEGLLSVYGIDINKGGLTTKSSDLEQYKIEISSKAVDLFYEKLLQKFKFSLNDELIESEVLRISPNALSEKAFSSIRGDSLKLVNAMKDILDTGSTPNEAYNKYGLDKIISLRYWNQYVASCNGNECVENLRSEVDSSYSSWKREVIKSYRPIILEKTIESNICKLEKEKALIISALGQLVSKRRLDKAVNELDSLGEYTIICRHISSLWLKKEFYQNVELYKEKYKGFEVYLPFGRVAPEMSMLKDRISSDWWESIKSYEISDMNVVDK